MKRWTIWFIVCLVANTLCVVGELATRNYSWAVFNGSLAIFALFAAIDSYRKGQ